MGERKLSDPDIDRVFFALSHPARRRMLDRLRESPCCVGDLAADFDLSLNVVSKHLKALENARLVRRERQGKTHLITAAHEAIKPAADWLSHHLRFWTDTLVSLDQFIAKNYSPPPKKS